LPVGGNGSRGTAAQARHAYQPSASLERVRVLGAPCRGRCSMIDGAVSTSDTLYRLRATRLASPSLQPGGLSRFLR
jgi:hypothetical protein